MTLSHLYRAIQDQGDGELLIGAQVSLCSPGTQTPITTPFYSDPGLVNQLSNPFVASTGVIDIYMANPATVLLKMVYGTSTTIEDYAFVQPMPENLLLAKTPLKIINDTGTDLFLSGVDLETAEWKSLDAIYAQEADARLGWFLDSAFELSSIVRDANDAMTSANVLWPDGSPGYYLADNVSGIFPGRVDAWHVTWQGSDGTSFTYFQPPVTRNASGAITDLPAPQIVSGITDIRPVS